MKFKEDSLGERAGHSAPVTAVYESEEGAKAVLTFRNRTIYGSVELSGENGDFRLETVEKTEEEYNVVWAQLNYKAWQEDEPELMDELEMEQMEEKGEEERSEELLTRGDLDSETIAEYSVTVYYTKQFLKSTPDPAAFIDQLLAETNQGYVNSRVPLRVRLHCAILSSVPDGLPPVITLKLFTTSQGDLDRVRRSADAAILLVQDYSQGNRNCGVNWFNAWRRGQTIGTVRKSCAQGYFSFGHELAHGFGLAHDRRGKADTSVRPHDFAYGHIIKAGALRSIMAYSRGGEKRINYYSSPRVTYSGLPTGTANTDNARALTRLRFAVANIGDEREECPGPGQERGGCQDKFRSCSWLAVSCCWDPLISAGCPATCGLCPGLVPSTSFSCYDKLSSCSSLAEMGGCSQSMLREDCRASCGLCGDNDKSTVYSQYSLS